MQWEARYLPIEPAFWGGRLAQPHEASFYEHICPLNLLAEPLPQHTEPMFALIGFKCDEGVARDLGRTGAFEGPTAIRQRLAHLPVQNNHIHCYDVGNVVCQDHDLEASQQALADIIALLLRAHLIPIVMGGGHELAFSQYLGIKQVYPADKRLGIINFDAHFDMQPLDVKGRRSATTTFYEIAELARKSKQHFDYNCIGIQHVGNRRQVFDIAKQYNTNMMLADELHQGLKDKCIDFIDRVIDENDMLYLTLSLDVFSTAFAPGVSSIQPLGLYPWHVIPLLRQIAASGKVLSYDIVEHVPRYDIDHHTAKLAASFIYEIIHHHNEHAKPEKR